MKRILFILILLAESGMAFSQTALKKLADTSFEKQDYQTAAASYERLVQKGDSSVEVLFKLGDAYYYNSNYVNANTWYVKSYAKNKQLTANQFHRFIQTLKSVGNKEESIRVMDAFSKAFPQDLRVKNNENSEKYFQNPLQVSIKNLAINSAYSDYGASLYKDSLVFSSARPALVSSTDYYRTDQPFTNLFVAIKTDSTYNNVSLLKKEVTYSAFHEATPVFTKDGKTMYYTKNELKDNKSTKALDGLYKLYKAVFENGKWVDKGMLVIAGSEGARIAHPTLSLDEKTLYFAAEMKQGFGQSDIYSIALNTDGSIGLPINLGAKINSEGRESYPFITENNLLIFASDGHPGFGGFDLMALDLTDETAPIINLGATINSTEDDFNYVQKAGTNEGVFSSNRIGGKGDDDLYSFVVTKPIEIEMPVFLVGTVKDSSMLEILPNVAIEILDENGNVVAAFKSDETGSFKLEVEKNKNYVITYKSEGYNAVKQTVSIPSIAKGTIETVAILAKPAPAPEPIAEVEAIGFGLSCYITEANTSLALDSVEITLVDPITKNVFLKRFTEKNGTITEMLTNAHLNDSLAYTITLKKKGYFTKILDFKKQLTKPGIVGIHEALDLTLTKMEEGMDLAKVFKINPIYFDLNKFNIRPDAAEELNKIITIMNENPTLIIELGSHTDCRAPIAYNERLSDRRAKASANYIKTKIKKPARIFGKGYGESQLITNCPCEGEVISTCSDEEHQLNRRTEFKIIKF
jgi:outer membrane protein OmpA-like peptidoglycan-associated protein/tetratricopeptide (TPR) repeat protein